MTFVNETSAQQPAEVCKDLIYDVGMCNGDDPAYHLHQGYRILALRPILVTPHRQSVDFKTS